MKRCPYQPMLGASGLLAVILLVCPSVLFAQTNTPAHFQTENLVAWCIVPFDGLKRGPADRAKMLRTLGLTRVAYDWRDEHVATFEEEILQYQKYGLEYFAFWGEHDHAFELFAKYDLHPQIWKMLPQPQGENQASKIQFAAKQVLPLVERTRKLGCKLGIYNHGGWTGEPQNMVALCKYLHDEHNATDVGIVYNLHHAHQHLDTLAEHLESMRPYLLTLNLNGMNPEGDVRGEKILPLGAGTLDTELMEIVLESGYSGPIGIIGHTQDDVEKRLQDNIDGLQWLLNTVHRKQTNPKPTYRTYPPVN